MTMMQSGTYNNGWMVLDVDALEAGWQHDVLWLLEQLPGYTEAVSPGHRRGRGDALCWPCMSWLYSGTLRR